MVNLCNFVLKLSEKYANIDFLLSSDNLPITYSEFGSQIVAVKRDFTSLFGNEQRFHFSIIAPNCTHYLYHLFAYLSAGCTAVNLNPNLSNVELEHRLVLGKVSVLITTSETYEKLKDVLAQTGVTKVLIIDEEESSYRNPIILSLQTKYSFLNFADAEIAFLQFTGGTTGIIKAAAITHQQVLDNIQQLIEHIGAYISLDQLKVLIVFPFYHIFSIVFNVLFFMKNGGSCVLYKDLRNTDGIVKLLRNHPINFTVAVNTWYKKLMQHPEFNSLDFSNIKISLAGAEYVPLSTKNQWQSLTGKPLYSAYGLTETCSLAIVSPLDDTNKDDTIGVPLPRTEVVLLDEENEIIDIDNQAGELALKGPQLTSAYYNNPEETRKAFHNGWFKTGDIALRVNGGFYKIIDRKKDMINVSGNKIYPNEVESVISCLDEVLDVGVVAKKSEKSGEEVAACVVLKEGSELTDDEIIAYCRGFLSRYKIPKHIYRYPQLPKTAIGKTARRILRKEINNENE